MRTPKKSSGWSNEWIPFCQCFAVHLIPGSTAIIFMIPSCQYFVGCLIPCSSSVVRWQESGLIDAKINGSSSKFAMIVLLVNPNSFNFAIVSPSTPEPSKSFSRSGAVGAPGGCCCHTVVEQQHSKRKNPSHKQRFHRTTAQISCRKVWHPNDWCRLRTVSWGVYATSGCYLDQRLCIWGALFG